MQGGGANIAYADVWQHSAIPNLPVVLPNGDSLSPQLILSEGVGETGNHS